MNIDFSEGPASVGQLVPIRVREGALSLTYGFLFALPCVCLWVCVGRLVDENTVGAYFFSCAFFVTATSR